MKARFLGINKYLGFTLIELIITLIILGTLSVTVVPKFFGPALFDSYTARDQVMSALRTMQLRAMQMTNTAKCHQFIISTSQISPPSPEDTSYYNCADADINTANAADNPDYLTVVLDSNRTDVTFDTKSAGNGIFTRIKFNNLGQPELNLGTCAITGCKITVGEVAICISGQGAIYGCS